MSSRGRLSRSLGRSLPRDEVRLLLPLTLVLLPLTLFSRLHIDLSATLLELNRLPLHLRRVLPHILGDLHGAELGAAHGTEVRHLRALGRKGLVVIRPRGDRIQRQIELILPAEVEPGLTQ